MLKNGIGTFGSGRIKGAALLSLLKKNKKSRGRAGLAFNETGLAIAHYDEQREVPLRCQQVDQCRDESPELAKAAVEQLGIGGCLTTWVLTPKEYSLLQVEAPDVGEAEMAEALRWKIKDMVSFEVADAIVDYFTLPEDAYRGRSKMLYAAVLEAETSKRIQAFVKAAGLTLDRIEIPELALMRLKALEGETLGTAVLGLQAPHSLINLSCDDMLYLTRQVDTPATLISPDAEEIETRAANMVLDLQRSLDFYESQIGKPPCLRLLVCPLQFGETPLLGQLRYNLAVELVQLDLGEHLQSEPALSPALQAQAMMAIAAVLPEDEQ